MSLIRWQREKVHCIAGPEDVLSKPSTIPEKNSREQQKWRCCWECRTIHCQVIVVATTNKWGLIDRYCHCKRRVQDCSATTHPPTHSSSAYQFPSRTNKTSDQLSAGQWVSEPLLQQRSRRVERLAVYLQIISTQWTRRRCLCCSMVKHMRLSAVSCVPFLSI